jgi:serine/threonine-protein kinase
MGVILYEAVTGRVPFDAGTFNQLMFKIVLSEVPPPETIVPDLDPAFSSIISKSMARDLTQRFQTTVEFIAALDGWLRSGAAVSLPPAGDAATAGLLPAGASGGARAAMGSQTNINRGGAAVTGPGTSGNWASSQPDEAPGVPKKSSAGLAAALAAVGILVMGGAAFAAYSVLGKKVEPTVASSASSHPIAPAEAAEPKPEVALTPTLAAAPAASVAAEVVSAAPSAAVSAALGRDAPKPPAAAVRPVPGRPGAARPAAAPARPGAPTPKPGGGTPDFGY